MTNVIAWIKANPVTVVSAVVAVAAIVLIFWWHTAGDALRARIGQQKQTLDQIERFHHETVQVPPAKPNQPPQVFTNVVINPQVIDVIKRKYQKMSQQHDTLFNYVIQKNRQDHHLLIHGLFTNAQVDQTGRFDARRAYRNAFSTMLKAPNPDSPYPGLNAGMPLSQDQLTNVVQQVDSQIQNENYNLQSQNGNNNPQQTTGTVNNANLSLADIKRIRQRKQAALIQAVQANAKSISIYADTDAAQNDPDYPFMVDPWATSGNKPTMSQLWEGQLELWIQQDIARAIARTNKQVNPGGDELNNPVKRLIGMRVVPGYIGLQTRGAMPIATSQTNENSQFQSSSNPQATVIHYFTTQGQNGTSGTDVADAAIGGSASLKAFFNTSNSYGSSSNSTTALTPNGTYPPPVNGQRTNGHNQPVPHNFYVSPTGRVSNAVYDVRQVKVSLIVNYRQLPVLFNAIAHINFMTVLCCNIHDVNPYAALAEGYDYGQGNIVRVDMLIETLWIRAWTAKLMPKLTREYVGIDPPTDLIPQNANGTGMPTPAGMPSAGGNNP